MRDPLELTQAQLEVIAVAANALPVAWRERFRASVADNLERFDRRISDCEIAQTVESVRRAFVESIGNDDDW
jgi:hypothetical protein